MAGARLHQYGSIIKRTTGLLKSEVVAWNDRPLWYDIVTKFPPKTDPRLDKEVPKVEVKQIFYPEDYVRARIYKRYEWSEEFSLRKRGSVKTFIEILVKEYVSRQRPGATVDEIFEECEAAMENHKWKLIRKGYLLDRREIIEEEREMEARSTSSEKTPAVNEFAGFTNIISETRDSVSSKGKLDSSSSVSDSNKSEEVR